MYQQPWSKRNPSDFDKDSFLPEALFTASIGHLGSAGFLAMYTLWTNPAWEYYFIPVCICFFLPFLAVKSYDFAQQVEAPEFKIKWYYTTGDFDEEKIGDEGITVFFQFSKNFLLQKRIFKKKNGAFVKLPETTALKTSFQVAIKEYDIDAEEHLKDLGHEAKKNELWWLFRLKMIPWNPNTWRINPYLNPDSSLEDNGLKEGHVIKAIRVKIS